MSTKMEEDLITQVMGLEAGQTPTTPDLPKSYE